MKYDLLINIWFYYVQNQTLEGCEEYFEVDLNAKKLP